MRSPAELITTACALAAGGAALSGAPADAHAASVPADNAAAAIFRIDIDSSPFVVCGSGYYRAGRRAAERRILSGPRNPRAGTSVSQDTTSGWPLLATMRMQKRARPLSRSGPSFEKWLDY